MSNIVVEEEKYSKDNLPGLVEEINNYSPETSYRTVIKIQSKYYYSEIKCLDIRIITLSDNILRVVGNNSLISEFHIDESFYLTKHYTPKEETSRHKRTKLRPKPVKNKR